MRRSRTPLSDGATTANTEGTWADNNKTSYPMWFRVLQRLVVVWLLGGIPIIAVIAIITHPDGSIFGLMAIVWVGGVAALSIALRGWTNSIELTEHIRLLQHPEIPEYSPLDGHYLQVRDNLQDTSRTRYITGRNASWTDRISDENGRTIGRGIRSHGQGGLFRLHESDGTPILEILPGEPDLNRQPKDTYDITDENEHVLGRVKWRTGEQDRRSSGNPIVMVLATPDIEEEPGNREEIELLVAQTGTPPIIGRWRPAFWIFEEKSGRKIAEFGPYYPPIEEPKTLTDRLKRRSVYSLHVLDQSLDRRTLLGLSIVCGQKLEEAIIRRSNAD
jgi:hypothetical protein